MLRTFFPFLALVALAFSGCGPNPDYGKTVKKAGSSGQGATLTGPVNPVSNLTYGACKTMYVYGGTTPSLSADLAGSSVCAGVSNPASALLKVNGHLPAGTRLCLIPQNSGVAYAASCFTVNGQLEVNLTSSQFTALTLLHEANLGGYLNYLSGATNNYPPNAFASVR